MVKLLFFLKSLLLVIGLVIRRSMRRFTKMDQKKNDQEMNLISTRFVYIDNRICLKLKLTPDLVGII